MCENLKKQPQKIASKKKKEKKSRLFKKYGSRQRLLDMSKLNEFENLNMAFFQNRLKETY